MGHLLDSDVMIWHLRRHRPTERLLAEIEKEGPLRCSALSVLEVWSGVRPSEEEDTRAYLDSLRPIPVDAEISYAAADYWRSFRKRGITLGQADAVVAATARVLGLVLVTYNRDHYPMDDITLYEPMPEP